MIKLRYQSGKRTEECIRFVRQHFDQTQTNGRIRSLPGAIYKGLTITTSRLNRPFSLWKAAQPTYKASSPKQQPATREYNGLA